MSQFISGGVECGPSNTLKDVSSLVERDYGVQRDRYGPAAPGPSAGPSSFRTRPAAGSPSHAPTPPQAAFDLAQLRSHLPSPGPPAAQFHPQHAPAHIGPASAAPAAWADGYMSKGKGRAADAATAPASNWGQEFDSRAATPPLAPWQRQQAFAPPMQYGQFGPQPFYPQQQMMPMHPQPEPFLMHPPPPPPQVLQQAPQAPVTATAPPAASTKEQPNDLLARTAQDLVDSLTPETLAENEKLANSQFMSLLRGLGDGSVVVDEGKAQTVEGSEITEGAKFVQSGGGGDWAAAFNAGASTSASRAPVEAQASVSRSPTFASTSTQDAWAENIQNAILMNDGVPTQTARPKSVHFDEPQSYGVPRDLAEALGQTSTAVPGAGLEWEEDLEDDFDTEALQHFAGPPRVENRMDSGGIGMHEKWASLAHDWDNWDTAPIEPYAFHSANPYTLGAPIVRELSPTTMGVLELEAAVQQEPRDADAWLNLGLKQQENEREDAAIRALNRATQIEPNLRAAYLALAVSYTNDGREDRAHAALEKWIELGGEDEGGLLSETPGETRQERQARIIERLIHIARQNPDDLDVDVQVALGVLFNASEDYDKAEDCFSAALEARPEDWVLYNRLGATLANSGRSHEAIKYYHRALSIHPNFVRAQFNLGISYINLAQYRLAAQCILDAIRLQHADVTEGYGASTGGANAKGVTPDALWTTLRMACLHLNRPDLVTLCNSQDLGSFPLEL
ncbi:hypothetical protein VHUM_02119 [Vanrija humicola]|uniref:PEX18/PEX21 C-terminal domain-containing protein n=1 Tax=Vanrija humicola TaxID=5417 RepID=A0A7D8V1A1_VANHU|nr:hypothetical protein VHUM_02119 [Vanrija humicola]